jgi:hypothetical protein
MVNLGELPIGTNTRGYFMIHNVEDFEAADGQLKAKIEALTARRSALLRAFQALHRGYAPPNRQIELFEGKTHAGNGTW